MPDIDLRVQLGRLTLPNPVLVASGTFGYAREMEGFVPLARLGGIVPKTITAEPRIGNHPWRTVETCGGMLNSIGLDNDGLAAFIEKHLPYLGSLGAPIVVSIAGRDGEEFAAMAAQLEGRAEIAALELNLSCPNVAHGADFATDPKLCAAVVAGVRRRTELPLLAKLTPNVTDLVSVARAAADGGADALVLINTVLGMAVDWRRRRPLLGNVMGGLSGPAIKPIALRCVHQVARAKLGVPIIGVGGVATLDDCLEFLVAGASAIQVGTANFYRPRASIEILEALPGALAELGATSVTEIVGTLNVEPPRPHPEA